MGKGQENLTSETKPATSFTIAFVRPRFWTHDPRTTTHHVALASAPSRLNPHDPADVSLFLRVTGRKKVADFPCCIPGPRHVAIRSYRAMMAAGLGLHERCFAVRHFSLIAEWRRTAQLQMSAGGEMESRTTLHATLASLCCGDCVVRQASALRCSTLVRHPNRGAGWAFMLRTTSRAVALHCSSQAVCVVQPLHYTSGH